MIFPTLLFIIPAVTILGLAIFLGNEKERKVGLVIIIVALLFFVRFLFRHLIRELIFPSN